MTCRCEERADRKRRSGCCRNMAVAGTSDENRRLAGMGSSIARSSDRSKDSIGSHFLPGFSGAAPLLLLLLLLPLLPSPSPSLSPSLPRSSRLLPSSPLLLPPTVVSSVVFSRSYCCRSSRGRRHDDEIASDDRSSSRARERAATAVVVAAAASAARSRSLEPVKRLPSCCRFLLNRENRFSQMFSLSLSRSSLLSFSL